ncbi:PREDICTED: O-acetyl-ADP-ribose deacetylase MACROD2 isoform X1 [Chinchilla lanigera]|uniref:Mono-ADP ribosylhydrolase 2 n=1 Tax=Chinchilla lanigera TaxID=34839 RepID=A0A8C2W1N6_CHILA|nr:PREDICTED: O-acetyl-ADP-ribose deacetylase MACROD2 isoform X1 [Chinchilla lanigera]XP_013367737.1 PREDICTED: O-acetyl-ADP-ribose deacetylase MACROD2 isoform X1 [Chinchilla lanigera]
MYPSNKKKKVWREEKERLLKMTLEERRKEYVRDYVALTTILSWKEEMKGKNQNDEENTQETSQVKKSLSEKVSLYRGDITLLEVDAIVNAANASLLGGGGVDGCIHRAAGPCLLAECRNLNGCETGHAKITCGYDLPAKHVIHTVGPIARGHINGSHKEDLANCYKSSLKLVKENNLRSVAFPCISTGIYGFPNEPAAVIALGTIKEWLAKNHQEVDRIIFCVFLEVDFKIYKKKMSEFFPVDDNNEEDVDMKEESEGLEPKGLSPPHKKSKAKKPECSKDSSEDENGPEEKQSAEEIEGQSQEAGGLRFLLRSLLGLIHRDGVSATTVPSPAAEETVEVCKEEESAKDGNITKDNEVTDHSVCDQDHPDGQENDSTKNEIKLETESQSSYMETEELSSNQEDATIVEQPEVIPLTDDQEEKEGANALGEDTPTASEKSQGSSDTETAAGPDVEMNSQADSINDPTESQQDHQ